MYESPINIRELTRDIQEKIKQDQEEKVRECIWKCSIEVDKEELIKALNYDRNQYEKGFADALDKMRKGILRKSYEGFEIGEGFRDGYDTAMARVLNIIDKLKAESEE